MNGSEVDLSLLGMQLLLAAGGVLAGIRIVDDVTFWRNHRAAKKSGG